MARHPIRMAAQSIALLSAFFCAPALAEQPKRDATIWLGSVVACWPDSTTSNGMNCGRVEARFPTEEICHYTLIQMAQHVTFNTPPGAEIVDVNCVSYGMKLPPKGEGA